MNKYLFRFKDISILVNAYNKQDAITILSKTYENLFDRADFEIIFVGVEIDKDGQRIEY